MSERCNLKGEEWKFALRLRRSQQAGDTESFLWPSHGRHCFVTIEEAVCEDALCHGLSF